MSPEETRERYINIALEAWEREARGWRRHGRDNLWFLTRRPEIDADKGDAIANEPHSFKFAGPTADIDSLMYLRRLILNEILDAVEAA